jgi:hypothetical protein
MKLKDWRGCGWQSSWGGRFRQNKSVRSNSEIKPHQMNSSDKETLNPIGSNSENELIFLILYL